MTWLAPELIWPDDAYAPPGTPTPPPDDSPRADPNAFGDWYEYEPDPVTTSSVP